jgi:hypothetical protein
MKTPILVAILVALGTSGQLVAQDSNTPKNGKPTTTPETAGIPVPFEIKPSTAKDQPVSAAVYKELSLSSLGISTNAIVISSISNRYDLIEARRLRLEGSLVPLVNRPTLVTFLQLFNPFAPAEYGGMRVNGTSQGFGNVFYDPVRSQPGSVLISVGDNPPKADEPVKTKSE